MIIMYFNKIFAVSHGMLSTSTLRPLATRCHDKILKKSLLGNTKWPQNWLYDHQGGHNMITMWLMYDNMATMWLLYDYNMASMWLLYDHNMAIMWLMYDHNMATMWLLYNRNMALCSPGSGEESDLRARAAAGDWTRHTCEGPPSGHQSSLQGRPRPLPAPAPPHIETSRGQEPLQTMITDNRGPGTVLKLVLCSVPSVSQSVFTITEKAPTRAFSWLKAPTSAFTFKSLLRHYAKQASTAW